MKSIFDNFILTVCDVTINTTDSISKMWQILYQLHSTMSINSDGKNARFKMNCYILHVVLLVIILLF